MHRKWSAAGVAFVVALLLAVPAGPAGATIPAWDLTGTYTIVFTCTSGCDGDWPHTMDISIVNLASDPGTFSGTGFYDMGPSTTWTVTGTLSGSDLVFDIDYDANTYAVHAIGSVEPDGTLSGTATGPGQGFDWESTAGAAVAVTTVTYEGVTVSGGYQPGHFPEVWSLEDCDLALSATVDLNGMVDDFGGAAHAWSEIGVRSYSDTRDFNPNGAGVWLATDYDWAANTFDPDPVVAPTLDLDDKLILQKQSGQGEGAYDLPSVPPAPGNNHHFWFDRDGVDPWQNPETANTGGLYDVVISLHATSATTGTAYMMVNGLVQGFEVDGNWNTMELSPAGMTFTGDMTKMQVFYGIYGYGAVHSASFNNVTVTGCPVDVTPPTITITTPPNGAVYGLNQSVLADYECTDAESGVATCDGDVADGAAIDTSSVGAKTFTVNAADNAGNTSTLTYKYTVVYGGGFSGFFQPIDNNVVNKAKAGQAIPVKWRLLDFNGQPISDPASFAGITSGPGGGTCADELTDAIEEYAAGSSGLQYLGDGYWQFNWKTPKGYAGQCRTMTLTLNDLSEHSASFMFK